MTYNAKEIQFKDTHQKIISWLQIHPCIQGDLWRLWRLYAQVTIFIHYFFSMLAEKSHFYLFLKLYSTVDHDEQLKCGQAILVLAAFTRTFWHSLLFFVCLFVSYMIRKFPRTRMLLLFSWQKFYFGPMPLKISVHSLRLNYQCLLYISATFCMFNSYSFL